MKPIPKSPAKLAPLLVFGAHPDDIEFGCGGVVALETRRGRPTHLVVCSRGEAATHGTPKQRAREAQQAAKILGATIEWITLDGDAHLELKVAHTIKLAKLIRQHRPGLVLAPCPVENQHPDHDRLGKLVRDAARLARYGGVKELRRQLPHRIGQLLFYALTEEVQAVAGNAVLIDISDPALVATWTQAMQAHASQMATRRYVEMQLLRARLNGHRAGVEYAQALFPNDPPLLESLTPLERGARHF